MNSTNNNNNFHSTHEMTPSFPLHNNNNNNNKLASYLASYLSGENKRNVIQIANRVDPVLYQNVCDILKRINRKNTFRDWLNNQLFEFVRNNVESSQISVTLDSFKDADFVLAPDYFKSTEIWDKYLEHLSDDEFKKWDLQLNEMLKLSTKHNKRKFH